MIRWFFFQCSIPIPSRAELQGGFRKLTPKFTGSSWCFCARDITSPQAKFHEKPPIFGELDTGVKDVDPVDGLMLKDFVASFGNPSKKCSINMLTHPWQCGKCVFLEERKDIPNVRLTLRIITTFLVE